MNLPAPMLEEQNKEVAMEQFAKILFPVDLSGIGEKITPYVRMMVNCHKAKLDVLHVLETFSSHYGMAEAQIDLDKLTEGMTEAVESRLDQLVADHFSDLSDVSKTIIRGRPGEQIRDYAKQNNMDLIIMASHARKGLDYAFVGSVAHKVARNSAIPVLLINPSTL